MVGRGEELDRLKALLSDEGGALAVVSGEAGIGKTRLLEELTEAAVELGHLTLVGRAAEYERELPFGLVIDAVDPYLESLESQAYERLARDGVEDLAGIFPALRGLGGKAEEPVSATERFRIHNSVRDLLERLAARQPILFVLEDVHWADGASLELITHLIRRPPQAAVTLGLSFRTGQVDRAAVKAIADRPPASVTVVELGPLDAEQSAALLSRSNGSSANGVNTAYVQRESGGNPFYLLQLAEAGVTAPTQTQGVATGPTNVPAAVSAAIDNELAGLSRPARVVAEVAAVIGDPFEVALAEAVAEQGDAEFTTAVDELASSKLIRAGDTPRRFAFRHPLVRTAIYEGAPPGTAMAVHRKVARLLMGRGASAPEIAHHVERSAEPGDMAAVDLLRDAANDAAARAPTSAARWFDAAFELLPATAPVETKRDLLVGLAGSKAAAGDLDGAHAAFLEAVALTQRDDPLHIPLIRGIVGVEQLTGEQLKAKTRLEEALAELGDEPSPGSVTLKIALSTNGIYLDERDEMFTWGLEAVKDADGLDDPLLVAAANSALTLGSAFTGRLDIALERADRATEMIDSLSDEELAKGIDAIGSLAGAELYLDRFESSGRHGERGIRVARETGQGELIAMLHPALGTSLWVLGELERSREILSSALESARLSKNAQAIAWAAFNLEYVALIAGDLDEALALGEESVALTEDMGDGLVSSHAGVVHGATLMEMGRPEEGIDLMTRRAGAQGQRIAPGPWRATYLEDLVRARVVLGQLDEATESARCTREQAEKVPLPVAHVMASRAEAHVLLAQGQAEAAAKLALQAVEAAESISAKPHAATSRALAGRAFLIAEDRERGGQLLELAASEYDAMGAGRYRDEVEAELRQAGLRSARKSKRGSGAGAGIDSLTGRELEVAELIRDRHTNKEIAGELFLSLKTVESHVRNIFGKLGVSSRVQIARAMEARGESTPA